MGCTHPKGQGKPVGAPERRTLLTSKPKHVLVDLDVPLTKKGTGSSTKLGDSPSSSFLMEDSTTCDVDVPTPSPMRNDFVATDMIPQLLFPAPPTSTLARPDANRTGLMSELKDPYLIVGAPDKKSEAEGEGKPTSVAETKAIDMKPQPPLSTTPTFEFSPLPGSVRSNVSGSTVFTFGPAAGQSSCALGSKLKIVEEIVEELTEEELDAPVAQFPCFGRPTQQREATIPEAPGMALALENALHSVVDMGENLWNKAHSTCASVESVFDENGDACTSLQKKKSRRGSACC